MKKIKLLLTLCFILSFILCKPINSEASCAHLWSDYITEVEPTCTTNGYKYRFCYTCGESERTTIDKLNHIWSAWEVDYEPSCDYEGSKSRYCYSCNDTEECSIPKTEHDWSEWEIDWEPSCDFEGSKSRYCYSCDETEECSIAKTKHDWSKWKTVRKATTYKKGKKERYCYYCETYQTKYTAKKIMSKNEKKAVAATKKFFKYVKAYNTPKMVSMLGRKIGFRYYPDIDNNGWDWNSIAKQQFKKNFDYTLLDVSTKGKIIKVKAKIEAPSVYDITYNSMTDTLNYVLKHENVSDYEQAQYFTKRMLKRGKNNYDTNTITVTISLKKQKGKWLIYDMTSKGKKMCIMDGLDAMNDWTDDL